MATKAQRLMGRLARLGAFVSIEQSLQTLLLGAALLPAHPAVADDAQIERLQRQIDTLQRQLQVLQRQVAETNKVADTRPASRPPEIAEAVKVHTPTGVISRLAGSSKVRASIDSETPLQT
jgi:hypothetical protein